MATVKFTLLGTKELQAKIKALSLRYEDAVTRGINRTCIDIQRDAVRNIEAYGTRQVNGVTRQWLVDTGRMRASISLTFSDEAKDLLDSSSEASAHEGTRSRMASAAQSRRAKGVGTRVHYASHHELGKNGQKRRPFLGPAGEQNKANLLRNVGDEIKKVKPQ